MPPGSKLSSPAITLAVVIARSAGLETTKSGRIFFSRRSFPINGVSLLPRLFRGRSMSVRLSSFQLDFAWRIRRSVFIGGRREVESGGGGDEIHDDK